jgi:hypothetical protein
MFDLQVTHGFVENAVALFDGTNLAIGGVEWRSMAF